MIIKCTYTVRKLQNCWEYNKCGFGPKGNKARVTKYVRLPGKAGLMVSMAESTVAEHACLQIILSTAVKKNRVMALKSAFY